MVERKLPVKLRCEFQAAGVFAGMNRAFALEVGRRVEVGGAARAGGAPPRRRDD